MNNLPHKIIIIAFAFLLTSQVSTASESAVNRAGNAAGNAAEEYSEKSTEKSTEKSSAPANEPMMHTMKWTFTGYEQPDLASVKTGRFAPQRVRVIDTRGLWALIETYDKPCWIYYGDNLKEIERRVPLFNNFEDSLPAGFIEPQTVKVLKESGSRILIETENGEKWADLNFSPPVSELEGFLSQYGGSVSVYYENLKTGYSYGYNADRSYFAASVVKAPYAHYVYNLAENGKADLNAVHTYRSSQYSEGTGVIRNMEVGTSFTENQLLKYAIRNSDNVALKMLIGKYGTEGFRSFAALAGVNPDKIKTVAGAFMSAKEAGLFAKGIYNYIEMGTEKGAQFKEDLMSTSNPMITSSFPIARKYGWANKSFHDMAIIYAKSPYVLVIMSEREGGTTADFRVFKEISTQFEGFNAKYF